MAVEVTSLKPTLVRRHAFGARLRVAPAGAVLAGMVVASTVARAAVAMQHSTPRYFPDEYIYTALARSIAHGRLTIRGTPAHFPALLEPLLSAPVTLFAGVETAYRLTQGMHAIEMSLAAIPIYLLAGRLGLPSWQRLACAAFGLAMPELVYASYMTADAVALPLALGAVYAGVVALERRTGRSQALFLLLAGLAIFARVQYVVLPAAFVVSSIIASGGNLRDVVRTYRVTLVAIGAPVVGALVLGPSRALGYYHGVLDLGVGPGAVGHWFATDAMMLVFACGVILVPAALVGLWLGIARPISPPERPFATFAGVLAVLLLLELAVYAASGTERYQGRYLEALPPLVPLLFCLGMRRMSPRARWAVGALSLGSLVLAARVPMSGYVVADGPQDSPFLQAVSVLEQHLGTAGGSLLFGLLAGALAILAGVAAWRPRPGTALALGLAVVAAGSMSFAAASHDTDTSKRAMRTYFPSDVRWVDHARLGQVAVLVTPSSPRGSISGTLFWNTSVTRLLQMRGAQEVDVFGASPVRVRRDGALLVDGSAYRGPLLVEEYADRAQLDGAKLVTRTISTALWRPAGTPRLVSFTQGRYLDGWLDWRTNVTVWPGPTRQRTGTVCMTLHMPVGVRATIDLAAPGLRQTIAMPDGATRHIALPVHVSSPWRLTLKARRPIALADNRFVSAKASPPRFVEGKASASACR